MSSSVQTGALGWIMMGSPTASAASRARCSAGKALFPARFSLRRALTPTITSRWRSQTSMAFFGIDEPEVFELADNRRDHARRRDVETGLDAGFRDFDDVAPEALKGIGAGRPGVDSRGDAAGQNVGVGVHAVVAYAVVHVHVDIDESRRDQQPLGIDDLAGLGGVNVLGDRAHTPTRDRHVARGLETLRGVDDGAAGYQEVVHREALA